MKITILTLFEEFFTPFKNTSIIKKAIDKGLVEVEIINFRNYSTDKLKRVDDAPYGGGAGMVIKPEPVYDAYQSIVKDLDYKLMSIDISPLIGIE